MSHREHVPGDGLLHPAAAAALVTLVLNDHFWKGTGPGWVTGRLSDVAILIIGPLAAQALAEQCEARLRGRGPPRRAVLIGCAVGMAMIMALINTSAPAAEAYRWGLGALQWPGRAVWSLLTQGNGCDLRPVTLTMDPGDLWTIPAAAVPVWLGWARTRSE
jgi:hypothetical protein